MSADAAPSPKSAKDEDWCLLAVPKKGRLFEKCQALLAGIGLTYTRPARSDIAYCSSMPIKLVFLPAKDIPRFVADAQIDVGITGQDMVAESDAEVTELVQMGFGKCKLAVQAPVKDGYSSPSELLGKRVATSFPHLAEQFFKELNGGKEGAVTIQEISGSVEAACGLDLADAIVDLVETGTTMRAAGLEVVSTVMSTQTCLIANPHSTHEKIILTLKTRIEGYLMAKKNKMMYYNVPKTKLAEAILVTPGRRAPTVTQLEDKDWVSVGSMVPTADVNDKMDKLQLLEATDIFVVDVLNCRG